MKLQRKKIQDSLTRQYLEEFLGEVSELLSPKNGKGKSLILSIESILYKCKVSDYSAEDAILDSAIEGYDYILKKETRIKNAYAWIKVISSRLIYKRVNENIKAEKAQAQLISTLQGSIEPQSSLTEEDQREILYGRLKRLSKSDQALLKDRFIQGKSRKEVQDECNVSEAALRRRESRAIKRLKNIGTDEIIN